MKLWGAAALRLYRRGACSIDKWKMEKIVHCQFSIINCFGLVLVSVKRRNEVKRPERRCLSRRRVCGAHSETQWRSSSADAALTFWYFWVKPKVRIRTWSFGSFASRQRNGQSLDLLVLLGQAKRTYTVWSSQKYECSIEIKIKHLYPYETIEKLYVGRIYP